MSERRRRDSNHHKRHSKSIKKKNGKGNCFRKPSERIRGPSFHRSTAGAGVILQKKKKKLDLRVTKDQREIDVEEGVSRFLNLLGIFPRLMGGVVGQVDRGIPAANKEKTPKWGGLATS